MLPVSYELHPGIDDVRRVLGVVAPESVLQNTDIVHLPAGVDGSPFDSELSDSTPASFHTQTGAIRNCVHYRRA